MKRSTDYDELTRLTSTLLDKGLSSVEQERLETLLAADPRARRLYMQIIDQEIELVVASAQGEASARSQNPVRQNPGFAVALWRRWIFRAAVACGVAMLFALLAAPRWFRKGVLRSPQTAPSPLSGRNSWSEDFESGDCIGWFGRIVATDLPPGSKFGITPAIKVYPGDVAWVIQLPEDWNRGLVTLTPESTLNVTYRLANRTHVNVFMHTLSEDPGGPKYAMYQLTQGAFPGRSGRWQTASIPFSGFARKVAVKPGGPLEFAGGPPRPGEPIATLSFASIEPADLIIDRVWIAPSGPPREEIIPLRTSP